MVHQLQLTLGPALADDRVLQETIAAGATACRINLSHCRADALSEAFGRVRAAAAACGVALPIGADLRGRKLRIGPLPDGGIELVTGSRFSFRPVGFDAELLGSAQQASVNCPALAELVHPGDTIALHDGALRLRVEQPAAEQVVCLVEVGGRLAERSGFNVPGRALSLPALTNKDQVDLDALTLFRPDFVYLSYCETAADVQLLRAALDRRELPVPIVAKIERAVAIDHLAELVAAADSICLARGDLGVEIAWSQMPAVQRQVLAAARAAGKPALVAGEVLYSMVAGQGRPSRAELTDVLAALEQGATGFVLSDETAIGRHPTAAVRCLRQLIHDSGVVFD